MDDDEHTVSLMMHPDDAPGPDEMMMIMRWVNIPRRLCSLFDSNVLLGT